MRKIQDLVCSQEWKVAFLTSMFMVGLMVVLGSDCVNLLLIIRERLGLTLNIKTRRVEGLSVSSFLNGCCVSLSIYLRI